MKLLVSNIQRFSLHDGPGIRTTVFLVGCNLRCPWCANPENRRMITGIEDITKGELVYKYYSQEELVEILNRDKEFYGSNGGVTFSGGEPLIWKENLLEVCKMLKAIGVNRCIETSLCTDLDSISVLIEYIDHWIIDLKTIDKNKYMNTLGFELESYINNIMYILSMKKDVLFRIPIMKGFNDSEKDIREFFIFFKSYGIENVHFIFGHKLAERKYELLNEHFEDYSFDSEEKKGLKQLIDDCSKKFDGNVWVD